MGEAVMGSGACGSRKMTQLSLSEAELPDSECACGDDAGSAAGSAGAPHAPASSAAASNRRNPKGKLENESRDLSCMDTF